MCFITVRATAGRRRICWDRLEVRGAGMVGPRRVRGRSGGACGWRVRPQGLLRNRTSADGRCVVQGCRKRGKPVIVATNMLESMIQNPAPTRAEVSDISIAVREGTDAVMLSGETAYGEHPMKSMQTMSIVAKRTEFRYAVGAVTSCCVVVLLAYLPTHSCPCTVSMHTLRPAPSGPLPAPASEWGAAVALTTVSGQDGLLSSALATVQRLAQCMPPLAFLCSLVVCIGLMARLPAQWTAGV